jgi:hypothetical protein
MEIMIMVQPLALLRRAPIRRYGSFISIPQVRSPVRISTVGCISFCLGDVSLSRGW